jgi:hydroxymethylpyrimidine/phosphomethylpyrimidine kinase
VPPAPRPPIALTIAGSDPSGGAGIQADLKTFSALSVYGAAAITAITVQDTRGVSAVRALEPALVAAQARAVLDDLHPGAVKLGMLANAAIAGALADLFRSCAPRHLVVDPVLVSKGGHRLLDEDAIQVLRESLLPLATVLTPNLPEAAALLDRTEGAVLADPERACRDLAALGPRAVLLKGGHAGGAWSDDLLWDGAELLRLPARRIGTLNTHGTGCTLSAALAALLARQKPLHEAAREAKAYVTAAIAAGADWQLGAGQGPVHHFHAWWPEATG